MKKVYSVLLTVFLIGSCSTPDTSQLDSTELQFADQKWELVRMTGSITDSETVGDAMLWQEYYIFALDGTFIRVRETDGKTIKATGTFEVVEYNNDESDYLELVYQSGQELAGSCIADKDETLMYRSNTEISNTWHACDGPGLDYMLVEN